MPAGRKLKKQRHTVPTDSKHDGSGNSATITSVCKRRFPAPSNGCRHAGPLMRLIGATLWKVAVCGIFCSRFRACLSAAAAAWPPRIPSRRSGDASVKARFHLSATNTVVFSARNSAKYRSFTAISTIRVWPLLLALGGIWSQLFLLSAVSDAEPQSFGASKTFLR